MKKVRFATLQRSSKFGWLFACIGFMLIAASLITLNVAVAADNLFKLMDAKITASSDGVISEISDIDGAKVTTSATFHKVGDSITYQATIKNTSDKDYIISGVSDDNQNDYVEYSYTVPSDKSVAAGESFTLDVVATYKTAIPDISARTQSFSVKFIIDYSEDIPEVPNTGFKSFEDGAKTVLPIVGIIVGATILAIVALKSKSKSSTKILLGLVVLGSAAIAFVAKALETQIVFELDSDIELKSIVAVGYEIADEQNVITVPYGETLPLDDPAITGYNFDGWQTADGEEITSEAIIVDDLEVIAKLTPHTYTVVFDKNAGSYDVTGSMDDQTFTYDAAQTLSVNGYIINLAGYELGGWNTAADGSGVEYANEEEVSNLIAEQDGIVTLYAQWEKICEEGYICYYANGGDGSMDAQAAEAGTEVVLDAPNFSRQGYGLAGWNTKRNNSGTTYGPNQTIRMTSGEGLKLYASWIESAGELQSFSCGSLTKGEITALTDVRDGQTYAVARLADDKCWMVENLRLDFANTSNPISAENTNKPTTNFVSLVNTDPAPASVNEWCTQGNAECFNQVAYNTKNINQTEESSRYGYGVYYNWYTATAGNGTYSSPTWGRNVAGDICPNGWHLPTGVVEGTYDATGDFGMLSNALGGAQQTNGTAKNMNNSTIPTGTEMSGILRATPNNFTYAGYYSGSSIGGLGSNGYYFSSTAASADFSMYDLYFNNTAINLNYFSSRYGRTIRCVAAGDYTIEFNKNFSTGGSGGWMPTQSMSHNETKKLEKNKFTRTNYRFVSWNTEADGSGTSYEDEQEVVNLASEQGEHVTLYAQWEQDELEAGIRYHANGEDVVGKMDDQYVAKSTKTATLNAANFSRSGYGFIGWNTEPDGSGTLYGPMETINMPSSGTLDLYADWLASAGTLQDFVCIMASDGITALTDVRDGQTYAVAKLADNHCWMIENLRLNFADISEPISVENTKSPTDGFIERVNTDPAPDSADSVWCQKTETGCSEKVAYDISNITRTGEDSRYGYGVYYSWYTAKAGSTQVGSSICPRGWRLSTRYDFSDLSNSLGGLRNEYGFMQRMNSGTTPTGADISKILRSSPNNFVYSGNSRIERGNSGYYWGDDAVSGGFLPIDPTPRYLSLSDFVVDLPTVNANYGSPIRCVAADVPYAVKFDKNHNGEGSGWMSDMTMYYDYPRAIYKNDFTRDGYDFVGWNTEPDGSGVSYGDEEEVLNLVSIKNGSITLYAQWSNENAISYSVKFEKNHNSQGSGTMSKQYLNYGEAGTLKKNTFTRGGYDFVGWNTKADGTGTDYGDEEEVVNIAARADGYITLYAKWEYAANRITYDANGGEGAMHPQTVTVGGENVLDAPNFKRAGYGFVGWNTEANGSGTLYGPNETITILEGGELKLYASWIASSGNLQNFDCSTLASGDVAALTDSRDGQVYAVAKLADGKCWMTENLRLDFGNILEPLDTDNTNNPTDSFLEVANAAPESDQFCAQSNASCTDKIGYTINNITRTNDIGSIYRYSHGVYYNWYTATAGRGTYETAMNTTVDGDICPAGWHLPIGTGSGDFGLLSNALGGYQVDAVAQTMNNTTEPTGAEISKRLRVAPNNFLYSGERYTASSWGTQNGTRGYFWSATSSDTGQAAVMDMYIANTYVNPGNSRESKQYEIAVRCIAN